MWLAVRQILFGNGAILKFLSKNESGKLKCCQFTLSSPSLFAGSFFIPLFLIVFLYFKIFLTQKKVASRRQQIKTRGGGGGATSASGTATREQQKQVNDKWKPLNNIIELYISCKYTQTV